VPQRYELSDRSLAIVAAATLAAIAAWFILRNWLPGAWRTPGSPQLYLAGVAGTLLLLVPALFTLAKRSGAASPRAWFNAHVACSFAGAVLIAAHSGGFLRRPPALLLLALAALAALGIWARLRGSRHMAATFASRAPAFRVPEAEKRERLHALIGEKRRVLAKLDPGASEGTFSVTLAHRLRAPRLALAYGRLAREEARLLGTRAAADPAQAWWRPLHLALAWTFAAGVLIHVVTVSFFAGYVADGGAVTWWHLRAWGAGW
jgi:hypothetical protein